MQKWVCRYSFTKDRTRDICGQKTTKKITKITVVIDQRKKENETQVRQEDRRRDSEKRQEIKHLLLLSSYHKYGRLVSRPVVY